MKVQSKVRARACLQGEFHEHMQFPFFMEKCGFISSTVPTLGNICFPRNRSPSLVTLKFCPVISGSAYNGNGYPLCRAFETNPAHLEVGLQGFAKDGNAFGHLVHGPKPNKTVQRGGNYSGTSSLDCPLTRHWTTLRTFTISSLGGT
jgi:hypothetical protein